MQKVLLDKDTQFRIFNILKELESEKEDGQFDIAGYNKEVMLRLSMKLCTHPGTFRGQICERCYQ